MRLQQNKRRGRESEGRSSTSCAAHVAGLSPPPFEGSHKAAPPLRSDNGATNLKGPSTKNLSQPS